MHKKELQMTLDHEEPCGTLTEWKKSHERRHETERIEMMEKLNEALKRLPAWVTIMFTIGGVTLGGLMSACVALIISLYGGH